MGWLEGILSGYSQRNREIQQQELEQAHLSAEREGKVYEALLGSEDPYLKTVAGVGLINAAAPLRRKSGLSGFLGQMEQNPAWPVISKYLATPQEKTTETTVRGLPSRQGAGYSTLPGLPLSGTGEPTPPAPTTAPATKPAGYLPAPPGGAPATGQAALPATSPTEVTSPPPAAPQPLPVDLSGLPGRVDMAGPPPPPSFSSRGEAALPPASVFQTQDVAGPQVGRTDRTTTTVYPHIPSAADRVRQEAQARSAGADLGEQESYIRVARALGETDAKGLERWAADQRARGAGAATPYAWRPMEYTDQAGQTRRILTRTNRVTGEVETSTGEPLPPGTRPLTPGLYPNEVAARRQTQNPLLWNQALTQARGVLGVDATPEEVLTTAGVLFDQAQQQFAIQPGAAGAPPPPPGAAPTAPAAPGAPPPPAVSAAPEVAQVAAPPPAPPPSAAPAQPSAAPAAPAAPATSSPAQATIAGIRGSGQGQVLDRTKRIATPTENLALGFYQAGQGAIDALTAKDPTSSDGSSVEDRIGKQQSLFDQYRGQYLPDALNLLRTGDQQRYKNAEQAFAEAYLRRVSGAQIRPDEFAYVANTFFFAPGDAPETLQQKRYMRALVLDGLAAGAQTALRARQGREYQPAAPALAAPLTPAQVQALSPPAQYVQGNSSYELTAEATRPPLPAQPGAPAAAPGQPPTGSKAYQDASGAWHIAY